jgi:hypothetical protein
LGAHREDFEFFVLTELAPEGDEVYDVQALLRSLNLELSHDVRWCFNSLLMLFLHCVHSCEFVSMIIKYRFVCIEVGELLSLIIQHRFVCIEFIEVGGDGLDLMMLAG